MKALNALRDMFADPETEEGAVSAPVRQMAPPVVEGRQYPRTIPPVGVPASPSTDRAPEIGDRVLHKERRGEYGAGIVLSKAQHVPNGACYYVMWTLINRVTLCYLKELRIHNIVLRGNA
jgi:hypothetical protein